MPDNPKTGREPTYPGHHWGPMAADPWADIAPESMAWHDAVKHIWLRDGGTEDGFQRAFPRLAAYGCRNR